MSKINIKFLSDEGLTTFKQNIDVVYEQVQLNPKNNSWVYSLLPENLFITKKYQINDFNLKEAENYYSEVDFENSVLLYENLKSLPKRILTDERFWLWLYLDKFYNVTIQAMELKGESTIRNQWTFSQGARRGLFFGVLSRRYLRTELTIDESLDYKYELTKYITEKPNRFRNLSWRSYSNQKKIVLGALKAQKDFEELYPNNIKNSFYDAIAKRISRYGSVNLLDAVTEEKIYEIVFNYLKELSNVK